MRRRYSKCLYRLNRRLILNEWCKCSCRTFSAQIQRQKIPAQNETVDFISKEQKFPEISVTSKTLAKQTAGEEKTFGVTNTYVLDGLNINYANFLSQLDNVVFKVEQENINGDASKTHNNNRLTLDLEEISNILSKYLNVETLTFGNEENVNKLLIEISNYLKIKIEIDTFPVQLHSKILQYARDVSHLNVSAESIRKQLVNELLSIDQSRSQIEKTVSSMIRLEKNEKSRKSDHDKYSSHNIKLEKILQNFINDTKRELEKESSVYTNLLTKETNYKQNENQRPKATKKNNFVKKVNGNTNLCDRMIAILDLDRVSEIGIRMLIDCCNDGRLPGASTIKSDQIDTQGFDPFLTDLDMENENENKNENEIEIDNDGDEENGDGGNNNKKKNKSSEQVLSRGVPFTHLVLAIGREIERDFYLRYKLNSPDINKFLKDEISKYNLQVSKKYLDSNVRFQLIRELGIQLGDRWDIKTQAKIGSIVVNCIVQGCRLENSNGILENAFTHEKVHNSTNCKTVGLIRGNGALMNLLHGRQRYKPPKEISPIGRPMLVPPRPWKNINDGPYFYYNEKLMRYEDYTSQYKPLQTTSFRLFNDNDDKNNEQEMKLQTCNISDFLQCMNVMQSVAWTVNERVLRVMEHVYYEEGGNIAKLPEKNDRTIENAPNGLFTDLKYDPNIPENESIIKEYLSNLIDKEDLEDLEDLGNETETQDKEKDDKDKETGKDKEIKSKEKKLEDKWTEYVKEYKKNLFLLKKYNYEQNSLRSELVLRLNMANDMLEDSKNGLYFPMNIDFRGRVYPIPPHLNHIGSDICRGILKFHKKKKLGKKGWFWLRVHLANHFGFDKVPNDQRCEWTEERMDTILSVAHDPIKNRWWLEADDPWQALATCFEISDAWHYNNGTNGINAHEFESNLPIGQDGSCNGLQHYAALMRDVQMAEHVNVAANDKRGDVYTAVKDCVSKMVHEDANNASSKYQDMAKKLDGQLTRKILKQTVMTSTYGVTEYGAKNQIRKWLEDAIENNTFNGIDSVVNNENEIKQMSTYLATLTINAIGQANTAGWLGMLWLKDCALKIASNGHRVSWITPLGLPCTQHYSDKSLNVQTKMQRIRLVGSSAAGAGAGAVTGAESITDNDNGMLSSSGFVFNNMSNNNINLSDATEIAANMLMDNRKKVDNTSEIKILKQKSAFAPNFIHSLDSTHCLMTARNCAVKHDLTFASVHDSFWTHACDVETMSEVLRDTFIEVHKEPLLEKLYRDFAVQYPDIQIAPPPESSKFDLEDVKKSQFFFA